MIQSSEPNEWTIDSLSEALNTLAKIPPTFGGSLNSDILSDIQQKIPRLRQIAEEDEDVKKIFESNYVELAEQPVTINKITDIIINDWFLQQSFKMMADPSIEFPPQDIRLYFLKYAYELSREMKALDIKSISPQNTGIWNKFFQSNANMMNYCKDACPLVKTDEGFKFAHQILIDYFVARSIVDEIRLQNIELEPSTSKNRPK